jgi:sulfatase maturation enzyme AslB (radical SAM superfamily)
MKFSQLTFIVTDDCNFRCDYCPQTKEEIYMERSTIEKAVAFFYPFLEEKAVIVFYGGEPLLAFDIIREAVSILQEKDKEERKKPEFSLTTNGSLFTDEILRFVDSHRFNVMLSFDGLTQDITRKPGSLTPTRKLIQRIQKNIYPNIKFSTNSVFTPATVNHLSASLQSIIESGGTDLEFDVADNIPWDDESINTLEAELMKLTDYLVSYYKENRTIPVKSFEGAKLRPKNKATFTCVAGFRCMTITPEENVWGCSTFHGYLKGREEHPDFHSYSFGKLDDFIKHHETVYPRILSNYSCLKQDYFFTENQYCSLCDEEDSCRVCPPSAAYSDSSIGKISCWVCRLNRIRKK